MYNTYKKKYFKYKTKYLKLRYYYIQQGGVIQNILKDAQYIIINREPIENFIDFIKRSGQPIIHDKIKKKIESISYTNIDKQIIPLDKDYYDDIYEFMLEKIYTFENLSVYKILCGKHLLNSWITFFTNINLDVCTYYGNKISLSLIRNAVTRIFDKPEKNIVELVVNGFDAYAVEGDTVGKFGMGFFSFLYWIINHPRRKINIYTSYFQFGNVLHRYILTLHYTPDEEINREDQTQFVKFIKVNLVQDDKQVIDKIGLKTGTFIELKCDEDNILQDEYDNINIALENLQYFYRGIITQDEKILNNIIRKKLTDNIVKISLSENGLSVSDNGSGIPLKIAINSLLIPSISSKGMKMRSCADIAVGEHTNIYDNGSATNFFVITVGGVIVFKKSFKNIFRKGATVLIDMPTATRVPVARNDIIISKENIDKCFELFLANIEKLVEFTTEQLTKTKKIYDIQFIDDALKSYTKSTPNTTLSHQLNDALDKIKNKKTDISYGIPYEIIRILKRMHEQLIIKEDTSFVLINNISYAQTENLFIENAGKSGILNQDLFYNKSIIIVDDQSINELVTDGGFEKIIFVKKQAQINLYINIKFNYNNSRLMSVEQKEEEEEREIDILDLDMGGDMTEIIDLSIRNIAQNFQERYAELFGANMSYLQSLIFSIANQCFFLLQHYNVVLSYIYFINKKKYTKLGYYSEYGGVYDELMNKKIINNNYLPHLTSIIIKKNLLKEHGDFVQKLDNIFQDQRALHLQSIEMKKSYWEREQEARWQAEQDAEWEARLQAEQEAEWEARWEVEHYEWEAEQDEWEVELEKKRYFDDRLKYKLFTQSQKPLHKQQQKKLRIQHKTFRKPQKRINQPRKQYGGGITYEETKTEILFIRGIMTNTVSTYCMIDYIITLYRIYGDVHIDILNEFVYGLLKFLYKSNSRKQISYGNKLSHDNPNKIINYSNFYMMIGPLYDLNNFKMDDFYNKITKKLKIMPPKLNEKLLEYHTKYCNFNLENDDMYDDESILCYAYDLSPLAFIYLGSFLPEGYLTYIFAFLKLSDDFNLFMLICTFFTISLTGWINKELKISYKTWSKYLMYNDDITDGKLIKEILDKLKQGNIIKTYPRWFDGAETQNAYGDAISIYYREKQNIFHRNIIDGERLYNRCIFKRTSIENNTVMSLFKSVEIESNCINIINYVKNKINMDNIIDLNNLIRNTAFSQDTNNNIDIYDLDIEKIDMYTTNFHPIYDNNYYVLFLDYLDTQFGHTDIIYNLKDFPVQREKSFSFELSKFIDFIFQTDTTKLQELNDYEKEYSVWDTEYKGIFDLQVVKIAANEGSTKSVPESVSIELLQNSLDVIVEKKGKIGLNKDEDTIEINVYKYDHDEIMSSIVLSVIDHIGINNFNTIISLMVPYLSDKVNQPNLTGEMGNGFFNVYRDTEKVRVSTSYNNKKYYMEDTLIKDDNGLVIDINKNIEYVEEETKNRTQIIVMFTRKEKQIITGDIIYLQRYIQNNFSLVDKENIKINLNGAQVNNIKFPVVVDNKFVSIKLNKNKLTESIVLTNGIPFIHLKQFNIDHNILPESIMELCDSSLILNLKKMSYHPTQSRTTLQISSVDVLHNLRTSILDTIFIKQMEIIIDKLDKSNFVSSYIIHYESYVHSWDQITPNIAYKNKFYDKIQIFINTGNFSDFSKHDFFTYYSNNGPSVAEFINNLLHDYKIRSVNKESDAKQLINKLKLIDVNEDIKLIIAIRWIINKLENIKDINFKAFNLPKIETLQPKQLDNPLIQKLKPYIDSSMYKQDGQTLTKNIHIFITSYVELYYTLLLETYKDIPDVDQPKKIDVLSIPKVILIHKSEKQKNVLGFYKPLDNTITIPLNKDDIANIGYFIVQLKKRSLGKMIDLIREGSCKNTFDIYFNGDLQNPGTIIHELEHFRIGFDHNSPNAHPVRTTKLYSSREKTIIIKERSFNDNCKSIYNLINDKYNFLQRWLTGAKNDIPEDIIQSMKNLTDNKIFIQNLVDIQIII